MLVTRRAPNIIKQTAKQTDRQTNKRERKQIVVLIVHIATYSHANILAPSFNSFYVIKGPRFLADRHTDGHTYFLSYHRIQNSTNS